MGHTAGDFIRKSARCTVALRNTRPTRQVYRRQHQRKVDRRDVVVIRRVVACLRVRERSACGARRAGVCEVIDDIIERGRRRSASVIDVIDQHDFRIRRAFAVDIEASDHSTGGYAPI